MSQQQPDSAKDKPWGGRFSESTDAFVEEFTASITFDKRLYRHDIQGSRAHARMLGKTGLLNTTEVEQILSGLDEIELSIEKGELEWKISLEDVHMNIEARLTDRIGIAGKKLHTGRSRNDQVATDVRLWLRDQVDGISHELRRLQRALVEVAEREADTILLVSPTCKSLNPSRSGIICWHGLKCCNVTSNAYKIAVNASMSCH